ncbi:sensor histidine kinase [Thermodesulfobacteriota bacterium]
MEVRTNAYKDHVSLIVEDTGSGMSEEVVKQIFLPFFTTKDVNKGTGLGLAVVHGIVSAHGGTIQVESEVDQGSRFEIRLPVNGPKDMEKNE